MSKKFRNIIQHGVVTTSQILDRNGFKALRNIIGKWNDSNDRVEVFNPYGFYGNPKVSKDLEAILLS